MSDQPEYDVFLCYSSKDMEVAQEVKELLDGAGLRTFFDQRDVEDAGSYLPDLIDAVGRSKKLLYLHSARSREARFVNREILEMAQLDPDHRDRRIVPVRLDDSPFLRLLKSVQHIDWRAPDASARVLVACRWEPGSERVSLPQSTSAPEMPELQAPARATGGVREGTEAIGKRDAASDQPFFSPPAARTHGDARRLPSRPATFVATVLGGVASAIPRLAALMLVVMAWLTIASWKRQVNPADARVSFVIEDSYTRPFIGIDDFVEFKVTNNRPVLLERFEFCVRIPKELSPSGEAREERVALSDLVQGQTQYPSVTIHPSVPGDFIIEAFDPSRNPVFAACRVTISVPAEATDDLTDATTRTRLQQELEAKLAAEGVECGVEITSQGPRTGAVRIQRSDAPALSREESGKIRDAVRAFSFEKRLSLDWR